MIHLSACDQQMEGIRIYRTVDCTLILSDGKDQAIYKGGSLKAKLVY